jgi:hypothetical protein
LEAGQKVEDITKKIIASNGADVFQARFIKNEGAGLLSDKEGKSYLMLDSADYWYDLIQDSYPKLKKCKCGCAWFGVEFRYIFRTHYDDVREIEINVTCEACGKVSFLGGIDIKYSPTERLIKEPITYCAKPKVKYKYKTINALWTKDDFEKFLRFCAEELGFNLYVFYWDDKERIFEAVDAKRVADIGERFLEFFVSNGKLDISKIGGAAADGKGVYLKERLWRSEELIDFHKCYMVKNGASIPSYLANYATEYIDNSGNAREKSKDFTQKCDKLLKWLSENFIAKRDKNCFDDEALYQLWSENKNPFTRIF